MYGQKQILQCLAIAIILAVFNFHRTVIKRNREVTKPKIIRKIKPNSRANEIDDESITVLNGNYSGYCIRYPFGKNVYANYDSDFMCGHICFDKLDTWLQKQCQANCCTKKTISINLPVRNIKKSATNGQLKTRNAENVLVNCYGGNGASLNNISQCEPEKTIIEPIIEILMNMEQNNPGEQEYECKIQTNIDQFICRNTTSATVDFVKLETINKTKTIMEYHDFLFNMAVPPETKTGSTQSIDRSMSSIFLAFTSLLVAFFIIRVIYKLFMTDHTEAFLRVIEMRRNLHDRLEQIHAELNEANQARANEANNNNIAANSTSNSEQHATETENHDNLSTISADDKEKYVRNEDPNNKQQPIEQSN